MTSRDWFALAVTMLVAGAFITVCILIGEVWHLERRGLSGAAATVDIDRDEGPAAPLSPYDHERDGL